MKRKKCIIIKFLLLSILFIVKIINISFKNNTTICLCVIAKNENLYVREFVEHYLNIGYNKIFIYDNNDKNGETLDSVINDYIKKDFVQLIDFRRRNSLSRPIFDAYKDCYYRNNKIYDWLSFFDMDEFLELNQKYKNIQDFLNDKIFEHCQNIKINWLLYHGENNLYYENISLQKRITKFNYEEISNKHIKSTVRGNLSENYWEKVGNPHTSLLNFTSCSSSGKTEQFDSPFIFPPDYSNAKLKHYFYKSFEEFCLKVKKGKADHPLNDSNKIAYKRFKILYDNSTNNISKIKIIKKIFNDSFYKIE